MRKFMRTRPAPPHPPTLTPQRATHLNGHAKLNGHPNGVTVIRRDDQHSTLSSRYWSGGSGGSGGTEPLWEDAEFPPCWRALGERRHHNDVVWMRPHELCSRPTFYGQDTEEEGFEDDEASEEFAARWCVEVGELGDGCICCAAAALSRSPALLARLVPPQSFRKRYNGAFRFKFWEWGTWREVVVDDRLPTRRGRLLTSRGARVDDFTLALLEKAYAKLYGSYARMRLGGSVSRALQDTTGGVVQSFCLAVTPAPLALQVLHSAAPRSTLIVATLDRPHHTHKAKDGSLRRLENGLIPGQAYCVTGLARVRGGGVSGGRGEEALVRVRSAGGQRTTWRGAWARGSQQWRALLPHDRDLLDQRATTPDEFWMSFADLVTTFSRLELVHIGPDDWMREAALHARRPWRAVLARRRWRPGHSAGGPPQAPTHPYNPHFHLQVPIVEGGSCGGRKCHVVVSVTQQYSCAMPRPLLGVGFAVYDAASAPAHRRWGERAPPPMPLDLTHQSTAREVVTFFTLPAGDYVVVPHTARAHLDAAFLLRIYTDLHTNIWEVNEDNMIIREIVHEFPDERTPLTPELRASLVKLLGKEDVEELDAETLRAALVRGRMWRGGWATRPSLSLCRALVTLRDARVTGQMPARDLPALTRILHEWKHIFVKLGVEGEGGTCSSHRSRVSSYRLRALLRAAGVAASNKVLECLVLRFARHRMICAEHFLMALTALHLAHERFRSLDAKLKTNPLSLEEVILMTIYS